MNKIPLLLRQRKLIFLLRNSVSLMTGAELARQLETTDRTIRSDIAAINKSLSPYQIHIEAYRSKGYRLVAEDSLMVRGLLQAETAFLTKEDRLRYLAIRLCLSDSPVPTDTLEDEMYVSRSTLENDLQSLAERYVLRPPRIGFENSGGAVSFEEDERKRRILLSELYSEHWNYHERSNAFYVYDFLRFLSPEEMSWIVGAVGALLNERGLMLEDSAVVQLNLLCAVMLERLASGHALPPDGEDAAPLTPREAETAEAAEAICRELEQRFHCQIPPQERRALRRVIDAGRLFPSGGAQEGPDAFPAEVREIGDRYLRRLRDAFGLDLRRDAEFVRMLLGLISRFRSPVRLSSGAEQPELLKRELAPVLELAWLFQPIARSELGRDANEAELLTLAMCLSGAVDYLLHQRPETRLRTVLCCHMPMPFAWALKRRILGDFQNSLDIVDIIPVNARGGYDFSGTDLILSTVRKTIAAGVDTLTLGALPAEEDRQRLKEYVRQRQLRALFPRPELRLRTLLSRAQWLDGQGFTDVFQAADRTAGALEESGCAPAGLARELHDRLTLGFFCVEPGILFLPSASRAAETGMAITVFPHRLLFRRCKLRAVAAACFRREDCALLLYITELVHRKNQSVRSFGEIRDRQAILELLLGTQD